VLKPLIDAQYRTLADAGHTGTAGFSAGGMVSLYMGWDYTEWFTRIGFMSGDISLLTKTFYDRVMAEPWREIRIYQDFGTDEGPGLYLGDLVLRDNLLGKSPEHWVVEGDHRYFVGFGHAHTIHAAATRVPNMMTFLFPGTEEPNELLCAADLDCDGNVGVTDFLVLLATWATPDGDIDGDGDTGITDFLLLLANWGPCL
jgi:hypothetical protein